MKIKMRTTAAGPGVQLLAGKTYEVGSHPGLTLEFAEALLDAGNAAPAPETTAKPDEGETSQAAPDEAEAPKRRRKRASKKVSGK